MSDPPPADPPADGDAALTISVDRSNTPLLAGFLEAAASGRPSRAVDGKLAHGPSATVWLARKSSQLRPRDNAYVQGRLCESPT